MVTSTVIRQSDRAPPPLVAFDFDGTLTWRDSFVAFLAWRAGPVAFAIGLATLAPAFAAYALHRDRGRLKAAVAHRFLGGIDRSTLAREARRFRDMGFDTLIRPDARRVWDEWKAAGARLFIVTASPEDLVAPFAEALGAERLIGTRLAFDARDRFTGALDGPNCRGANKVSRLRHELGDDLVLTAAYGDTDGDREMLEIARAPGFKVFTARP